MCKNVSVGIVLIVNLDGGMSMIFFVYVFLLVCGLIFWVGIFVDGVVLVIGVEDNLWILI